MTDILTMIVLGVASTLSVSVVALGVAARIRTVSKRAKRMSQRLPSGTSTHSIHSFNPNSVSNGFSTARKTDNQDHLNDNQTVVANTWEIS